MNSATLMRYKNLVQSASFCCISTASITGIPESAIMTFTEAPQEGLYLYTYQDSRKYKNLVENPRAAIILFEPPEYAQIDGSIHELAGDALQLAREKLIEKDEGLVEYHSLPRSRYFLFVAQRISLRIDAAYPPKYEVWNVER